MTKEKVNETKNGFFEIINRTKLQLDSTKKKKTQIKYNKKGDITKIPQKHKRLHDTTANNYTPINRTT